ncbi:MAG TPA: methyltransferase domain-containing protein [Candidatus Paceibacterota bacterium]
MFSDPASNLAKLGLTDGMKIADIGAGSGFYSIEAARRVGSSGRVFAIDIQKDLLDRLRNAAVAQHIMNIEVVWANAEKIGGTKLREASIDRAIASNILFQLDKPEDFALEMKRILKPGGKILIVDWSEVSTVGPKNLFPQMKAETMFAKNGFVLDQSFAAGDHHYGLVFTRT